MKFEYEDLILVVPEEVYEPREDSFLIAQEIKKINLKNKTVLEIGVGSGILSLIAAKTAKKIVSVDINNSAVIAAQKNSERNQIKNIEVLKSDLFEKIKDKFDLIIFNPPYVPSEEVSEIQDKSWSGGNSGREETDRFLAQFNFYLRKGGQILLLQSSLSNIELTLKKLEKFNPKVIASTKLAWEKLVVIQAHK